ncbi:CC181 protein, partial [Phainopepla nitens]|nr:CC181 protein [Phainopepla nitens]
TKMSEKEDEGIPDQKEDQADMGDVAENVEYEDDFEKDPECLTDEEEKQDLGEKDDNLEKEPECLTDGEEKQNLESFQEDNKKKEENLDQLSEADVNVKVIYSNEKYLESGGDVEQEHHESDTERERSIQESKLENVQEVHEEEERESYVLGKIEEANKELGDQVPLDQSREQKLKFTDEMNAQAPPPEDAEVAKTDLAGGDDVSFGLSQLCISDDKGQKSTSPSERAGSNEGMTDSRALVEKDGMFELLDFCDIESQAIFLPIRVSFTHIETKFISPRPSISGSLPADSQTKEMTPSDSKQAPDAASNGDLEKQKTEPANIPVRSSTYSLTPKQKELRRQIELRNERLRREEEERKRELEEIRRRENDIVFRAWLHKKKQQIQEEKRIRRAKQLEQMRMKEVVRDPEEAYRSWLKKKQQQYVKERRIEFLRRKTEEVYFFPRREDCDRAFRDWLRRKREEKEAAELAAKEKARQLRLEARRARQMRNIQYI